MKISTFLAGLFFAGMVVFAILYFQERDARSKETRPVRGRFVAARSKIDRFRAADTLQKGDKMGMKTGMLQFNNTIFSQPIDDKRAKAYIRNYESMALDLEDDLEQVGLPPLTDEIWMDSASLCSLGRLITQNQYNGLRLYLAAYGLQRADNDPQRADKGNYDYHVTMIAVPTKNDPNMAYNYIDVYGDPKTSAFTGLLDYHDVCPPTCPTGTGAARGDILADPLLIPISH